MMWFVWINICGIMLGMILTLCLMMFDDPRRVNGRKRGKR